MSIRPIFTGTTQQTMYKPVVQQPQQFMPTPLSGVITPPPQYPMPTLPPLGWLPPLIPYVPPLSGIISAPTQKPAEIPTVPPLSGYVLPPDILPKKAQTTPPLAGKIQAPPVDTPSEKQPLPINGGIVPPNATIEQPTTYHTSGITLPTFKPEEKANSNQ